MKNKQTDVFFISVKFICGEVKRKILRYKFLVLMTYITMGSVFTGYVLILGLNKHVFLDLLMVFSTVGIFLYVLVTYNRKVVALYKVYGRTSNYVKGIERLNKRCKDCNLDDREMSLFRKELKHELVVLLDDVLEKEDVDIIRAIDEGTLMSSF